ncbi:MAG: PPC domain-containing DNA-binding protein [Egibacteraceae bacterium]
MQHKLLQTTEGLRTYSVVLDKGDDPYERLVEFARNEGLTGSGLTGLGALSQTTVGWFNPDTRDYERTTIDEQCEVVSLIGDIAVNDGEPTVHAHIVLARRDNAAVGGHLFGGRVWPTLEIVVTESPSQLRKRFDPDVGLALIDLTQPDPP